MASARLGRQASPGAAGAKQIARRAGLTRPRLAAVRMCAERHVLATMRHPRGQRSRILCYHAVGTPAWGVNDINPGLFRRHMELALETGYTFVPADELAANPHGDRRLAVTFDDALSSVAREAAPILAELGIPWSVYVVTNWADGAHGWGEDILLGWREIEALAAKGATIGSHSVTHARFRYLSTAEAEEEIFRSREVIRQRVGITPTAFAIPMGQSRDWTAAAQDAALRAGYRHVYAQSDGRRPPGTVPRTFVTRFDNERVFRAALGGAFEQWEEWV